MISSCFPGPPPPRNWTPSRLATRPRLSLKAVLATKVGTSPSNRPSAFFTHMMEVDGKALKLELWDTAGQEKYHSVCHLYFRGANAALLVYDIAKKDTFHRAQNWWKELENEFQPEEIVVILVGNKMDLEDSREVTFEEGKTFSESNKLLFMETSAKLNYQVTEAFTAIARELLQREEQHGGPAQQKNPSIDLENSASQKKGKCCLD
ncbi:ras-related protein Rab-17 isoform X3 [Monodelphis domestica]|uniref:ras-related protein Rab-17 isoform X3 n=1 Tax=Monodelphis domestica TaxID=13616 RepID=UPI0024E1B96C|nr:ras-related protein Rab-17 isoform X3 [Monodelphis domestica]